MQFLKSFLAAFLALIIFSVIGIIVVLGIIGSATAEDPVVVKEHSILKINLDKVITEMAVSNPLEAFGINEDAGTVGLLELVQSINAAAKDENIDGIVLETAVLPTGYASIEEIREALLQFKSTGKFIYSYAELYTEGAYYLASVSDYIAVAPEGMVEFNGINSSVMFLSGMLEKFNVEAQIFRVGQYKSAVEPFLRKDLSDENREQLTSIFKSIQDHMLQKISESRGISVEDLKRISDQMEVRSVELAVEKRLIDEVAYYDQWMAKVHEKMNVPEGEKINIIGYSKYKTTTSKYISAKDEIAVIVAQGYIIGGNGREEVAGERYAKLIREAANDDDVKAIVLRINSPGGQLQASDLMWHEVKLATSKKPVIASYSDLAASGGYFMSAAATKIVSQPTTITGSIGIFGIVFNFGGLLEDRLGVTFEEVNTGQYSNIFNATRSLTDSEKQIIQHQINTGYDTFISRVADGRHLSEDSVRSIASGRIWSGVQAKEIGLVDELGGLNKSIEIAAQTAGIETYRINIYPERPDFLEALMQKKNEREEELAIKHFGNSYYLFDDLRNIVKNQGIQARLPFEMNNQ